jgi:hypothetical protein
MAQKGRQVRVSHVAPGDLRKLMREATAATLDVRPTAGRWILTDPLAPLTRRLRHFLHKRRQALIDLDRSTKRVVVLNAAELDCAYDWQWGMLGRGPHDRTGPWLYLRVHFKQPFVGQLLLLTDLGVYPAFGRTLRHPGRQLWLGTEADATADTLLDLMDAAEDPLLQECLILLDGGGRG